MTAIENKPLVLLFAEDTGSANYVSGIPALLSSLGVRTILLASEVAARHFDRLGVAYQRAHHEKDARTLLSEVRPTLVISGPGINLDSFGLDLIATARDHNVETVGVIDQRQNLGDRFRGRTDSSLTYAPDWILVPDSASRDYFTAADFRADHVVVCGHPYFDKIYEVGRGTAPKEGSKLRARTLPNCPSNAAIITFGTEPARSFRGSVGAYRRTPEYTLLGRGNSKYRTDIVLEEFLDALSVIDSPTYKVLRLHPHDPNDEEFTEYYCEFDFISDSGLPQDLLLTSDLVVGMSSMLLVEATLLGRPTLSIMPRPQEKSLLLSAEAGLTPCVFERSELRNVLDRMIRTPTEVDMQTVKYIFPPDSIEKIRQFLGARLASITNRNPQNLAHG